MQLKDPIYTKLCTLT